MRLAIANAVVACVGLLGLTPGASASGKPPLVQPDRGSIGLAGLHRPILAFYRTWGAPKTLADVVQPNVRTYTVATWSSRTVKLVVSFRDRAQRDAGGVSYRGPFRTARGDHPGTSLAEFMHHWPSARISSGGVTVGRTTFTLNAAERITGIELGVTPIRFPAG